MGINILSTKVKDPTDAVFGLDLDGDVAEFLFRLKKPSKRHAL